MDYKVKDDIDDNFYDEFFDDLERCRIFPIVYTVSSPNREIKSLDNKNNQYEVNEDMMECSFNNNFNVPSEVREEELLQNEKNMECDIVPFIPNQVRFNETLEKTNVQTKEIEEVIFI